MNRGWKLYFVLLQLAVGLFVVVDEHEQGLASLTLQQIEVALKICRKLDSGIVSKVSIEDLNDLRESIGLLEVLKCPILKQSPGESSEAANYVEDALIASFGDGHLSMIKVNPLSPFAVVTRLTAEHGNVGVPEIQVAGT